MTATDWRIHATEANQQRFADAQARLDDGDYPPGEVGDTLRAEDERFTDWYDRTVLASAEYERIRDDAQVEFDRAFPEPPDGSRIEFEADGGRLYAAFRENNADDGSEERRWYLYGSDDPVTWRYLVHEYRLPVGLDGVTLLVSEEDEAELVARLAGGAARQAACEALDVIIAEYPVPPGVAAGIAGDFHAWDDGRTSDQDRGAAVTADLHSVCPTCGDPYVGRPGCYADRCAATCGDPDHKPGECTDECWNPLGRDNSEAQR